MVMKEATSFQDEAFSAIKEMIMRFELKPGERINKQVLENKLGLKVAPIRGAIDRLRREHLVDIYAQSGSYVAKINVKQVYQSRFVRESIERLIVGQAVAMITEKQIEELHKIILLQNVYIGSKDYDSFFDLDEKFHGLFYEITDNTFVWEWLQQINFQFNRLRYLRLETRTMDWPVLTDQHIQIVNSIESKNVQEAQNAVSFHLQGVKSDLKLASEAYPDYFENA